MSPLAIVLDKIVDREIANYRDMMDNPPRPGLRFRPPADGFDGYRDRLLDEHLPTAIAIVKALSAAGIILPDHEADAVADVLRGGVEGE